VFVKAFVDSPGDDVFTAEAEGLNAPRESGGIATPDVILADRELLVLSVLQAGPHSETFWEQFAYELARLAPFDNDWGAGELIRATLAPFRTAS